ncbi:MAG: nicotinate phosphoribosyltransferase [Actinomycetota bacterium]|nr:nicotinate phosphoribosyltransferase [Actinomycetota bacterium]
MSWVTESNAALLTDLYELTMAASYDAHDMNQRATFDLFVRDLPKQRRFLVSCGLEQALDYLETLHFDEESISYLASLGAFSDEFLSRLENFRFSGDVWAIPEGEITFAKEPLLRVTAPLIEAQIVETFLLNCITFQTMVASKAARVAIAAADKKFVDFSPRRDHGADAALKAARAAYIAGAAATSNVLAGKTYGIPISGTMAHSYVMVFDEEIDAFRAYVKDFPDRAVLLVDTFDVEEGTRRAAEVFKELDRRGNKDRGVRIDSGDLASLAHSVRKILDEAGLEEVKIMFSGDLDEKRVKAFLDDDVPVDAFGVGTQLGTSGDAPFLGTVYKLVADANGPKIKLSTGKATLPGCKQVYRFERDGVFDYDLIAAEGEVVEGGRPLLKKVMAKGARVDRPESLDTLRGRCTRGIAHLPERLRSLEDGPGHYRVELSPELQRLLEKIEAQAR